MAALHTGQLVVSDIETARWSPSVDAIVPSPALKFWPIRTPWSSSKGTSSTSEL